MKQTEFRFYDKFPEQLALDVTQEQPQPDFTSINGNGLWYSNDTYDTSMNYTVNLNNVVVEDDEKPSLVKRILLKQLGIKYK